MHETADQKAPQLVVDTKQVLPERLKVTVIGHSPLFYFWPIWFLGYALGLMTYFELPEMFVRATLENPGGNVGVTEIALTDNEWGVTYCIVCMLIMVISNVSMRGWASVVVIVSVLFFTLLFAYLDWWDVILDFFGKQVVYMNSGFYFFFSTIVLIPWLINFFIIDRLDYWVFVPGQAIHKKMVGLGEQTYDISGMAIYKQRDDLFRHWILGLGSGDLRIATSGAARQEITLHNVLFLGKKIDRIQALVAIKPDQFEDLSSGHAPQ
jgi:hypothetical protein